ncbi:AlpA family phage regulatory protein [Methylolobus aquaticus]|nr:AlpA family phage regulatory protein [Methylolobus aquaticus]
MDLRDESLLPVREVSTKIGKGRTWIYEAIRDKRFPEPIRENSRVNRWLKSDVDAWIQQHVAACRSRQPAQKGGE